MNRHLRFLFLSACLLLPISLPAEPALPLLPQAATSFGATLADGWLYIYGGNTGKAHEFNRDCVKGDFFRLKLPDGTAWEKLPGGIALLSSSLVAHEGKIIRIGGMNARNAPGENNDLHSTDEVMSFDPVSGKWSPLPSLPEPRSSHDAVVVGDMLYVSGGWKLTGDDGAESNAMWTQTFLSLDLKAPSKGWQSHAQPFQRRAIATVAAAGRLWFIGGMDSKSKPSRAVDWFEPASGQWGKGPELPEGPMGGFGVAGCAARDRVLISPFSGKISALSTDGKQWEDIAKLEPARFFHRLLPMADGRLIAVGGSSRQGHVLTLDLVSLDPKTAATEATPGPGTKSSALAPVEIAR